MPISKQMLRNKLTHLFTSIITNAEPITQGQISDWELIFLLELGNRNTVG